MGSDPLLLVFDTSAAHCAAAVVRGDAILSSAMEPMGRGQAEALVPLLQRLLAEADVPLETVDALGVGVGPGNFTGTRIAVATARGLALSLGCPALGLSAFELMRDVDPAFTDPRVWPGEALVCVEAPRTMAYAQLYRDGQEAGAPRLIDPGVPQPLPRSGALRVLGYRADEIGRSPGATHRSAAIDDLPARLGRVALRKWRAAEGVAERAGRPAPIYVRPPDAAPPADPPPTILT